MRASSHAALLALLFVGYASFYLCRANVNAAVPLLVDAGYTKASLGKMLSTATFAYATGKFVLGAVGDALGGRRAIGLAIAGSVVFSLAIGTAHTLFALTVFAACNRFFQAGGWSGVVHIVARWFEPRMHGRVMGFLSGSYEFGNVCALALSGFVAHWGWRALFVVNPLLFAAIGFVVIASLPRAPAVATSPSPASGAAPTSPAESSAEPELSLGTILSGLVVRGSFWVTIAMSALLTFLRDSFLTWTPTYLYEVSRAAGHAEVSGAIVKSALFPAAGVVAALVVGFISDRLGPGRRAPIMAASLAVVVGLVLFLGHGGVHDPFVACALIAGVGLFLLGPYSLLAGAVVLDVVGKRGTATATGIIDGAGYLGATAAPYALGAAADRAGWSAAFDLVAAAALAATVIATGWSVVVLRSRS